MPDYISGWELFPELFDKLLKSGPLFGGVAG